MSDHDTVVIDCKVLPTFKKPVRRNIYLWKRANKPAMDKDMLDFSRELVENNTTSTPVDSIWNWFKEKCIWSIDTHMFLLSWRQLFLTKPGVIEMSVTCQVGKRGLIIKPVQPNSRLIGAVTKRYKKVTQQPGPNMHVGRPTTTSSEI